MSFASQERLRAQEWKLTTAELPEAARRPAPYVRGPGEVSTEAFGFCLPVEFAEYNLLEDVRAMALALFEELQIPWHAGIDGGPGNHLLSSQVQCVNALGRMVHDPERIGRAFRMSLGTAKVHEIEPGRFLTFEYIGDGDLLNEAVDGVRRRGAHCTSVDAAFLHTTTDGVRELVLVEWKYIEQYGQRPEQPHKDAVRRARYEALLADDGPIDLALLPFEELLQEPLYQLMRQQLLAHRLEVARAHGTDRVRVAHVLPAGNTAYQSSLHGDHVRAMGPDVKTVWGRILRATDRYVQLDHSVFSDPDVTSPEYVRRYF